MSALPTTALPERPVDRAAVEVVLPHVARQVAAMIELHRARWGEFAKGASGWTWHDMPPLDRDTPFVTQAQAFLDQVEGQPSRLCSLEEAVSTLRFNLSALASAESGARVVCASVHAR